MPTPSDSEYRTISLTNGGETIVSPEDYDRLSRFPWHHDNQGYIWTHSKTSPSKYMHRMVLDLKKGDERLADHINQNRADNRRENLRTVSNIQNQWNVPKRAANTSGYKGVFWNRNHQRWTASCRANGKRYSKGGFLSKEDARDYVIALRASLHGEFAAA